MFFLHEEREAYGTARAIKGFYASLSDVQRPTEGTLSAHQFIVIYFMLRLKYFSDVEHARKVAIRFIVTAVFFL